MLMARNENPSISNSMEILFDIEQNSFLKLIEDQVVDDDADDDGNDGGGGGDDSEDSDGDGDAS